MKFDGMGKNMENSVQIFRCRSHFITSDILVRKMKSSRENRERNVTHFVHFSYRVFIKF